MSISRTAQSSAFAAFFGFVTTSVSRCGSSLYCAELDALRVHEDQPHLVGRVAHEDRRDEGVDAARLPCAGRTGDEDVRQLGEVEHERRARRCRGRARPRAGASPPSPRATTRMSPSVTSWRWLFGTSTPIADCAGDRGEDPDVGRRHRVRDVVAERGDPVDLDAGRELELVAGDGRADRHADEPGVDAVLVDRRLEHLPPSSTSLASADLPSPLLAAGSWAGSFHALLRSRAPRASASLAVVFDDDRGQVGEGRIVIGRSRGGEATRVALHVVERDSRHVTDVRIVVGLVDRLVGRVDGLVATRRSRTVRAPAAR